MVQKKPQSFQYLLFSRRRGLAELCDCVILQWDLTMDTGTVCQCVTQLECWGSVQWSALLPQNVFTYLTDMLSVALLSFFVSVISKILSQRIVLIMSDLLYIGQALLK